LSLNSAFEPQINADERRFQEVATITPCASQVRFCLGTSGSISETYLCPSEFICRYVAESIARCFRRQSRRPAAELMIAALPLFV
jgi:hypothetical protein